MPTDPTTGLVVRPGQPEDADTLSDLFTATRAAAVPSMPPPVHSPAENRAWIAEQLASDGEVWVAEEDGVLVGMLLLQRDWLHSVYVDPRHQRQGIGTVLVELAQTLRPDGLHLWVFESNNGARRLYERHGFVTVGHTDGSGNDEKCPDVHMAWPDPLRGLRRRIDGIDERLAALLAERAAVTADIQRHKAVPGSRGRDTDREAEIARRMAALAPSLGEERIARIMDVVITVSLDAAAEQPVPDPATRPPDDADRATRADFPSP
jgi:RimJ/RimL family protein N-acetyltransferase/chorismate mutase